MIVNKLKAISKREVFDSKNKKQQFANTARIRNWLGEAIVMMKN